VLPGTYVDPDFRDFSHERPVTLRSKLPRRAVLSGGVGLHNVRGVRLEGFRVTGTIANDQEPMRDVAFVRNDIGGSAATAFQFGCGMENVLMARNRIHDIAFNGEWGSGYGMYVWGDCPKPGLRVRYNTFERIQADGMELGAITGFRIVGNDIRQIKWHGPADMDPHADALMIWADSSHGLVKDNRITDGNGLLFSGLTDVRIENNLIAHIDNWCFQSGDAVRNTYVNNTVYDCGYDYNGGGIGGGSGSTLDGERANGNILRRNLITSLAAADHAVAGWDHNLILHGDRGPGDVRLLPRFRDRIDWEPTNTPFQVGYRVAPAGAVSVCARYSGASRSACKLNRDVARRCGGIRAPRKSSRCQRRVRAQARRRTIRASTRRAGQHTAVCQRTAPRGTSPQPPDR
jgi:Right handed beta helix region